MAIIKKVVALSGEEYERLLQKAAAYDAIVAEQQSEAEAQLLEAADGSTDTTDAGEV